jgi:hypothetical protein
MEASGLKMLDGRANVFHAFFVAAFAVSAFVVAPIVPFAVFAAFGQFCPYVPEQVFGFFVFALFAQLLDFAFGLLEELAHIVVFVSVSSSVLVFAVFSLASEFGDGVMQVLECPCGFIFFASFAEFGDAAFLLVNPFAEFIVIAIIAVFAVGGFVAFAIGDGAAMLFQFLTGALGEGFGLVALALFAQGINLFFAFLKPRFQFVRLAVDIAFTVAVFAIRHTISLAGSVAVAIAKAVICVWAVGFVVAWPVAFVVVQRQRCPRDAHACD